MDSLMDDIQHNGSVCRNGCICDGTQCNRCGPQIEKAAKAMRSIVGGCRVIKPWLSISDADREHWRKKAQRVLAATFN